eukprot:SAG31_NODE_22004_length_536_cov_0.585812_1_plen_145_part_10
MLSVACPICPALSETKVTAEEKKDPKVDAATADVFSTVDETVEEISLIFTDPRESVTIATAPRVRCRAEDRSVWVTDLTTSDSLMALAADDVYDVTLLPQLSSAAQLSSTNDAEVSLALNPVDPKPVIRPVLPCTESPDFRPAAK